MIEELTDSAGNQMIPCGIQTSKADEWIFVCLDNNPYVGRRAWLFTTEVGRAFAVSKMGEGVKLTPGSKGEGVQKTGYGYLVFPERDLHAMAFDLLENEKDEHDVARRIAEEIWKYSWVKAPLSDDINGIDYWGEDRFGRYSFQVKRREAHHGRYNRIFLQLAETNPHKRYK